MGLTAARKAAAILRNARHVIAVEALAGAQGLELRRPLEPADGTRAAFAVVRSVSPYLDDDRPLSGDIEAATDRIGKGDFSAAVQDAVGRLE
jgi:histidine ammonia-lyase